MRYIFTAIGGSGSNYLIRALATRYEVAVKPDAVFRSLDKRLTEYERGIDQGTFAERAHGYQISEGAALKDVLPDYVAYLRADSARTAVFNTAAELSLFSALRIPDVVFLIRHPLHAYVSWAKPGRHADIIADLGGLCSPRSIDYYTDRWNAFTDELIRMGNLSLLGGLIRYEFAKTDAESLSLDWAFSDFDSGRRNHGVLPSASEDYLRQRVWSRFASVYADW